MYTIFTLKREDDHGKDVVEGNSADDHQGSHPCAVIHIINESKTQDGGAAPVGCLDEGAFLCAIFHQKFRQSPDGEYAAESDGEAEKDIASIEAAFNIIFCQVFKYQSRQGGHKNVFIGNLCEMIINYM